jgi:hypothetical protein
MMSAVYVAARCSNGVLRSNTIHAPPFFFDMSCHCETAFFAVEAISLFKSRDCGHRGDGTASLHNDIP